MSKQVCATSSCGREEFPSLTELIELEALARFVCHALGHQAGVRERASRLKIRPQEILDLFAELTAIRDAEGPIDDGFTVMAMVLICRHSKKAHRAFAITERVLCLKAMMADQRMRGWTIQDREPDCMWTESSIFAAVAKCTLRMENDRFHFDPDEFFSIALLEREEAREC